jgi:anthranilate synthase component 1
MKKIKIKIRYEKALGDMHTPVSLYNKLRDHFQNALLLEGADYHDRSDSKSFICLEPIAGFEAKGNSYRSNYPFHEPSSTEVTENSEVLTALKGFVNSFEVSKNGLPFNTGGLYGYSAFESTNYMEDIVLNGTKTSLKDNPDLKYQLFSYVLVFDHFKNELFITENLIEGHEPKESENNIKRIRRIIGSSNPPTFSFKMIGEERFNVTDEQFRQMVAKGIQHCKLGDTFQLVLSREFQQDFQGDDFVLYRCLRSINPSPYLFYFDYGDFKIMGSSPESQLQVAKRVASINPIAGTVLRVGDQEEDQRRAAELRKNPKELSEHVMLVDLARNDLSKHSEKVTVETYAETQFFSHVIHLVSKVQGELADGSEALDIYADTFPAGTLSGAPKYRALEIIAENENVARNFYGGAIGFLGFDGSINHAIIIRSVMSKNNTLVYQAGAGIVVESTPEGELQEVYNKTAAIRQAIEKANEL